MSNTTYAIAVFNKEEFIGYYGDGNYYSPSSALSNPYDLIVCGKDRNIIDSLIGSPVLEEFTGKTGFTVELCSLPYGENYSSKSEEIFSVYFETDDGIVSFS